MSKTIYLRAMYEMAALEPAPRPDWMSERIGQLPEVCREYMLSCMRVAADRDCITGRQRSLVRYFLDTGDMVEIPTVVKLRSATGIIRDGRRSPTSAVLALMARWKPVAAAGMPHP